MRCIMDLYNTFAGALVIGSMLLIGSSVIFAFAWIDETVSSARSRARTGRAFTSSIGIVLFVVASIAFGSFAFESAFDSSGAFVPGDEIRWEPAGQLPTTSFDRFDYGSASNAELAQRG